MYTIGSSKAGTTLAGVASEHKFAGWDGTTFKYETKKKTSSLLAAIFFFVSPVAQEALAKVMGWGWGNPWARSFSVPRKGNLQGAASRCSLRCKLNVEKEVQCCTCFRRHLYRQCMNKEKNAGIQVFSFFNGWPVPPGWKPPLTQRHGNTVKPSPAHPHKERARESRGWGELYPACTTRVLFGATELRFWQPRLQRSQRKKKGRGHSHSYLHWSAINTQTMKAFAGTTEAAGQLGKDAWKQTKKKKTFFF